MRTVLNRIVTIATLVAIFVEPGLAVTLIFGTALVLPLVGIAICVVLWALTELFLKRLKAGWPEEEVKAIRDPNQETPLSARAWLTAGSSLFVAGLTTNTAMLLVLDLV